MTLPIHQASNDASPPEALRPAPRLLTDLAREVAQDHGLALSELLASRKLPVAHARQALMWTLRQRGNSLCRIGMFLHCHHTTVMHGERRHQERMGDGA